MIRIALAAVLLAAPAWAETVVELPRTKAQLVLDGGWTRVAARDVIAFRHDGGMILAVTRADVPNPDAWSKDRRAAYADEVERGIKARIPGYRRTQKKLGDANGIPALDLEARRDGGAQVVIRVLLFRTYALSLAIEVPKGASPAPARALARTFAPPKESK